MGFAWSPQAVAKIRFSKTVEATDVQEAIRLMNVATQKAATDPRTGKIDMDMITTGAREWSACRAAGPDRVGTAVVAAPAEWTPA